MVLLPGCACCGCSECEALSTPESGNVFYEPFNFSSCSELPFQEAYGVCRWTTDYAPEQPCAVFFNPGIALRYTSLYRCSTFAYQGNVSLIAGVVIGGIHNIAFVEQGIGSLLPASLAISFLSAGFELGALRLVLSRERVSQSQYRSYFSGATLHSDGYQQASLQGSGVRLSSFPLYATMKVTRINGVWGGEMSVAGYGTSVRSPFTVQPSGGGDGKILIKVAPANYAESLRPIVSSISYSQESA